MSLLRSTIKIFLFTYEWYILREEEYKFARAYFVFKNDEDIVAFRDRFNGYVFVDSQGKLFQ